MFSNKNTSNKDLLDTISKITNGKLNESPVSVNPRNVATLGKHLVGAGVPAVGAQVVTQVATQKGLEAAGMDGDTANIVSSAVGTGVGGAVGTKIFDKLGYKIPNALKSGLAAGVVGDLVYQGTEKALDVAGVKNDDVKSAAGMMTSNIAAGALGNALSTGGVAAGAAGGAAAAAGMLGGWYGARGLLHGYDRLTGSDMAQQKTDPGEIIGDIVADSQRDAEVKQAEEERKAREQSPEGQKRRQEMKDILKSGQEFDAQNPAPQVQTTTVSEPATTEPNKKENKNTNESRIYDSARRILAINECLSNKILKKKMFF